MIGYVLLSLLEHLHTRPNRPAVAAEVDRDAPVAGARHLQSYRRARRVAAEKSIAAARAVGGKVDAVHQAQFAAVPARLTTTISPPDSTPGRNACNSPPPPSALLDQIAQRLGPGALQDRAEFRVGANAGSKPRPVGLAQRANPRVAVLPANLAVPVAAPVIEAAIALFRPAKSYQRTGRPSAAGKIPVRDRTCSWALALFVSIRLRSTRSR